MIIYNKLWLNNLHVQQQADEAQQESCITADELKNIKEHYPAGFYMPGLIIRIGLFILTCIIIIFSVGLLSLLLISAHVIDGFGWPLFLGIGGYIVLEVMVRQQRYFRSGVDDALLYISAGLITGAFIWMLNTLDTDYTHTHALGISIFVLVFSLYLTLRFADLLMSAVAASSFLAVVFFCCKTMGQFGLATLPFIMIVTSAVVYLIAKRLYSRNNTPWYYQHCLMVAEITGIAAFYLAGNVYVVQTLHDQLNGVISPGVTLPMAWFFWLWALLLPFVYIFSGIVKKDLVLLRIGLLAVAGAVATYRNYHHIFALEVALTLGGLILLAVVYIVIKFLKEHKSGFTLAAKAKASNADNIKIESLLIGRTFGHSHTAPAEQPNRFGGGDFGGGGANGNF